MSGTDIPEVPSVDLGLSGSRRRVVIPATCQLHGGSRGFTNLLVTTRGGEIVLDPHAVGSCVTSLDKNAATTLRDTLTQFLG
jgi:hypothetical protein